MEFPKTVNIELTERIIQQGIKNNCRACPFAIAFSEIFSNREWSIRPEYLWYEMNNTYRAISYDLKGKNDPKVIYEASEKCSKMIADYDTTGDMEPGVCQWTLKE